MMVDKKEYQNKIYELIDRMSNRLGVKIPRKEYPRVVIENVPRPNYEATFNEFAINPDLVNSGLFIGEELGHFFREKLKKRTSKKPLSKFSYYLRHPFGNELDRVPSDDKEEIHPHEFFGYLGRMILKEVTKEKDNLTFVSNPKKQSELPRETRLEHIRPYRFASAIDLSKISDYSTLFSLPDKEVRSRFFRQDPQYDLSLPITKAKITKREKIPQRKTSNLENIVKMLIPGVVLVLLISFLSRLSTTGYSVAIESSKKTSLALITIFALIGIIALLVVVIKKMNKKERK